MDDAIPDPKPRVGVYHPGTQHGPHTAWALDQHGLLAWYATGIYWAPATRRGVMRCLPRRLREGLERELLRRCLPALDASKVRTLGSWEWLVVLAGRLGVSRSAMARLFYLRNNAFGRRVGRLFLRDVDVLYCYNGAALTAFRAAERRGVLCALDRTTPTRPARREILLHEREVAPPEWQPRVDYDPCGRDIRGVLGSRHYDEVEAEEIARADVVFCGSEFCADSVRRLVRPRGPIVVEPYGVEVDDFVPAPCVSGRETFTLLFVGNVQAEKGVWYLLQAARRLGIPDLRVRLVGHLNVSPAALAPYEDLILHVPHVPRALVAQEYARGDVYVLPTLYEGSSRTVYEAMASGLPVITTPNAGSIVRDGQEGFIVPVRNVDALVERIGQLYEDADLRHKMGQAARRRALKFTWGDYGRRITAVVRRLWSDRRPAPSAMHSVDLPP